MLTELRIRNFAVIEHLDIRIGPGLIVLTGETGAGKSIIVDALALLLGERASSDVVRPGGERALVEAVFEIRDDAGARALLAEQGLETDDGLVILRREVAAAGRNRAWVNGAASTAAFVGELGRLLVDLHGQHEHQTLLRAAEQRAMLDAFGGCTELAAQLHDAWQRLRDTQARLDELARREREIAQRADFLRFQAEEIERAQLRTGEEEELEAEARRLDHAEELARYAGQLHAALYADEDAVASRVAELRRTLEQLVRIDAALGDAAATLENAYYALDELGRRMGEYARAIEHDPVRLDEIRHRQDVLFRLRSKYGPALEDVLAVAQRAREELEVLDSAGLERAELERAAAAASAELQALAERLSTERARAAGQLAGAVHELLPALGMDGARFVVRLEALAGIGAHGAEGVGFDIAVNAGFEPRPLARVASGGELSRIMLALKSILVRYDRVPTLVFDEIDAGIGGRVAHPVADALRAVAAHHQVFVITHLPQIARRADQHLLVEKGDGAPAATTVTELTGEARIRELARLLGGDPDSAVSLDHARELLISQ